MAVPPDFTIHEKVPHDELPLGRLVYRGMIEKPIRATKAISIASSGLGIAAQPLLFREAANLPLIVKSLVGGFLGFFIFITPLLLHQLVRRYIVRLYYNPQTEEFSAVCLRFIPGLKKVTTFTAEAVEIPPIPGMWTSFIVRQGAKKRPFFVNPGDFTDDKAYIKLMGYDKPMDVIRGPQFKK